MANIPNSWPKEKLLGIIHALRMHNYPNVEDQALDEIKAMVKALPSPEKLEAMFLSAIGAEVKNVQEAVGGIMRLVELYGKRDSEFKIRYKSRTKLPPRYNTLIELPRAVNFPRQEEMEKAAMTNKHELMSSLLKLSSEADSEGFSKFSQDLINCAQELRADRLPVKELYACIMGFDDGNLVKTAAGLGFPLTDINLDFSEITRGLGQITELFKTVETALQSKFKYLHQNPKTIKFIKPLQDIWRQIDQLSKTTASEVKSVNKAATDISSTMESELTPDSMLVNGKNTKIEWSDPDAEGYQSAFVTIDGKKFEVQEDKQGKRTLKPMEVAVEDSGETKPPAGIEDIGVEPEKVNTAEQKWQTYGVNYATEVAPIIQPLVDGQNDKIDYNKMEALLKKIDAIKARTAKVFNLKLMRLALGAPIAMPMNQQLMKSMLQDLMSGDLSKVNTKTIRTQLEMMKNASPQVPAVSPQAPNVTQPMSNVAQEIPTSSIDNTIPATQPNAPKTPEQMQAEIKALYAKLPEINAKLKAYQSKPKFNLTAEDNLAIADLEKQKKDIQSSATKLQNELTKKKLPTTPTIPASTQPIPGSSINPSEAVGVEAFNLKKYIIAQRK